MLRFLVQVNCVACDVPWFKVKHFYLNSAMFGNKAKTIVKELEPSNFFALEEADQTAALDALNDYATTQSKLNQLVEEDMLGRFGRIIRGANKAHLLPAVHHKLMSTVQTFAKIESFRTKFGVDSGMCGILMTEIGNLISTVDSLISSSEAAALNQNSRSREVKMNMRLKMAKPHDHPFKVKFGTGPLGFKLTPENTKKKTGAVIKSIVQNSLGGKEKLVRVGDRIVGMNNVMFKNVKCETIRKKINKSKRPVEINFIGLRDGEEIKAIDEEAISRIEDEKKKRIDNELKAQGKDLEKIALKKEKKKGETYEYEATFGKGPLGLDLRSRRKDGRGTVIKDVLEGGQSSKMGGIKVGHSLVGINGEDTRNDYAVETIRLLKKAKRPLVLRFRGIELIRPPGFEYEISFHPGPMGMELEPREFLSSNGAIVVSIAPNSQADHDGELHEGHQIIKVADKECKNRTLKEIKKLLISAARPCKVMFQIRDVEKENALERKKDFEAQARVEAILEEKRAPVKTVVLEKGPHGIMLELIPGQARGVRIQRLARSSTAEAHKDLKVGLEVLEINNEDFKNRALVPAQKKISKFPYPMTIVVQDRWLTHYNDGKRLAVAENEHNIFWSERNLALDFTLKVNPGSPYGAIVGTVKPEIQQGFAATNGLKVGYPLMRINDVDCTALTKIRIDELMRNARNNRPLTITFMKMTDEEIKAAETKGHKARIAGITSKVGKKKMNLRGLLWSMAPKAKKEIKMPQNAELALEVIPEYAKVLFELCLNAECVRATCHEDSFEVLCKGIQIFNKVTSRSKDTVLPILLKLCSVLIDSPKGVERFLRATTLLRMWIDTLWSENNIAALHQLAGLLYKITVAEESLKHKDYAPVYVFRVSVNKLNDLGEKMLANKTDGHACYETIGKICCFIVEKDHYRKDILEAHYKPPGFAGLWTLLAKSRKLPVISITTSLIAWVSLDKSHSLYALQPKNPRACIVPPFNSIHVLVMSMHRTSSQNAQVVFEYEAVFEQGSLGLQLDKRPGKRTGVVVHGIRDGSQADLLETIEVGDILIGIEETNTEKFTLERAMATLKGASRPLKLKFNKPNIGSEDPSKTAEFDGKFGSGSMGIRLDHIPGLTSGAIVTHVEEGSQASTMERLNKGDAVVAIAGKNVEDRTLPQIIKLLHASKRPMFVTFRDPNPKSERDLMADLHLISATRLLGAILKYHTSPGAMAIRLTQRRTELSASARKKKSGMKLLSRFKAKKAGKKSDLEDQKAESELEHAKISLDHPLEGILRVEDAEILTELVFGRILRTPHPSYDLTFHMFEVVEIITSVDPDRVSNLSIPAFIHMATMPEDDVDTEFLPHVLEAATASVNRIVLKYGTVIGELLVANGAMSLVANAFNRCRQCARQPEDHPFLNADIEILKWNFQVTNLLCSIGAVSSEQIQVILRESGSQFVPTLYFLADTFRTLVRTEMENEDALKEQGDEDGDGIIDDPYILEDVKHIEARVKVLQNIQAQLYEGIFRLCRNNTPCRDELSESKYIPATVNGIGSMALVGSRLSNQGLVALSRLLLLLTFDEDRLDPILSDKGAVSLVRVSCSAFTRALVSEDSEWDDFGGISVLLQNLGQVVSQVLRLIDIDHVLDHTGGRPLSRPLVLRVCQLLGRLLNIREQKYVDNVKSAVFSLVIILYEMASVNANRMMLVEEEAPLVLCNVICTPIFSKNVMISAAGAFFNITCNKGTVIELQDPSQGSELMRLAKCLEIQADNHTPHCQALMISAIRNIVQGVRNKAMKAAAGCRFLVPTLCVYLAESAHVTGIASIITTKTFGEEDEVFLPSLATESLELLKLITHIKPVDLKETRDRVLMGRKRFPAGLMSLDTLEELRKIRAEYKQKEAKSTVNQQHKEESEDNDFFDMEITLDDKDAVFDEYDRVEDSPRVLQAAAVRRSGENTVNIVKWVDFEFWSNEMKNSGVAEQHRNKILSEERKGLKISNAAATIFDTETNETSKSSHYLGTITTRSFLEHYEDNGREEERLKGNLMEVDALYDLNEELKVKQRREREIMHDRLRNAKQTTVNHSKVSKSELGRLARNMMQSGFFGERLESHSPVNIKRYSDTFDLSAATADGIDLSTKSTNYYLHNTDFPQTNDDGGIFAEKFRYTV